MIDAAPGDLTPMHRLTDVLADPYGDAPGDFRAPPRPEEEVMRTFCGT